MRDQIMLVNNLEIKVRCVDATTKLNTSERVFISSVKNKMSFEIKEFVLQKIEEYEKEINSRLNYEKELIT